MIQKTNKMQQNKIALLVFMLTLQAITGFSQFSIIPGSNSQLNWQNSKLIASDYISYFDEEDFNQRATGVETRRDRKNWTVNNCWSDHPDLPFRKELSVSPDGNTVELTIQFTQPVYKHRTDSDLSYTFKIPLKSVINLNWTAMVDRVFRPRTVSGVLQAEADPGSSRNIVVMMLFRPTDNESSRSKNALTSNSFREY